VNDLNERVQARLAELERLIEDRPQHVPNGDSILLIVWCNPTRMRPIVASWRERWDRHRPQATTQGYSRPVCYSCRDAIGNYQDSLCIDALSVLDEIEVEPAPRWFCWGCGRPDDPRTGVKCECGHSAVTSEERNGK